MKQYPMLSNWVTIKDYQSENAIIANEITDKVYCTDRKNIIFLEMLDGKTNPYTLPYARNTLGLSMLEIHRMLSEFSAFGLVRNNMFFEKSFTFLCRTIHIPKRKQSDSLLFKIINALICLFPLPIFIWGIIVFWLGFTGDGLGGFNLWGALLGVLAGFLIGGILHECGHAIASLATGGKVFEFGLSLSFFLIPGAYVATKVKDSATSIQKAQVSAAGIEFNLLLSGLALVILAYSCQGAGFFLSFTLVNLLILFDNLLFVHGDDGCWVFSHLFGLDTGITDVARKMVFTKEERKRLLESGCCGKASFCTYCLMLFLHVAGIALAVLSIISLLTIFVS